MSNERLNIQGKSPSNERAHIFALQCLNRKQPILMQPQSGLRRSREVRTRSKPLIQVFLAILDSTAVLKVGRFP